MMPASITLHIRKVGGSTALGDVLHVKVTVSGANVGQDKPAASLEGYEAEVHPDVSPGFESELRRHIETYAEEEPYEESEARRVRQGICQYSESLFKQLKLPTVIDSLVDALEAHQEHEGPPKLTMELQVLEDGEDDMALIHWESLECRRFDQSRPEVSIQVSRVLSTGDSSHTTVAKPTSLLTRGAGILNILVVVARAFHNKSDRRDVDYREISLPVTNVAERFPGGLIRVDVVSEGTWKAVQKALDDKPVGHYQMVHFGVHGEIHHKKDQLLFERSPKRVDAAMVAELLVRRGVRGAILNACRSAEKPGRTSSSLALTLVRSGLDFVIGMAYDTHRDAVLWFVDGLYSALLLSQTTVAEAVARGRQQMEQNPSRRGRFNLKVDVDDWLNPVLYSRDGESCRLVEPPIANSNGTTAVVASTEPTGPVAKWPSDFDGRDDDIHKIEYSLCSPSKITRVEGFRGAGKATLVRHLAEWWRRSNFAQDIFVVDFAFTETFTRDSPRAYPRDIFRQISSLLANQDATASHGRPQVYDIGPSPPSSLDGPVNLDQHEGLANFLAQTAAQRAEAARIVSHLKSVFRQKRCVILINNLHNVTSLVHGGQFNFHFWTDEMKQWLDDLGWQASESRAMILFSSLLVEDWIDKLGGRFVPLGGLDLYHATQYAARVISLAPYLTDTNNRMFLEKILEYYQCQPLAINVVLRQLVASGLSPPEFFEKTLCSEVELRLQQDGEQGDLVVDFIVGLQAMDTWLPGLDAVQGHCPQAYLMRLLEGDGPFKAERDPAGVFAQCLETLQDFALVRYTPGTAAGTTAVANPNKTSSTGSLKLHPLLPAFIRPVSRHLVSSRRHGGGGGGLDFVFGYLTYYLAERSCEWTLDGTPGDDNNNNNNTTPDPAIQIKAEMQKNWFNILASLQYCVTRPYGWNKNIERLFDFLMTRTIGYVMNCATKEQATLARISRRAVDRVARAFAGHHASATTPWWRHVWFVDDEDEEAQEHINLKSKLGKILHVHRWMPFPPWLMERMVIHYVFLRTDAWSRFDPAAWQYNEALLGLLTRYEQQQREHHPGGGTVLLDAWRYAAMKQDALIAAAEIAHQTSQHYGEGLQALAQVDLSSPTLPREMREHLDVRSRDISAELMGFVLDAENYEGDVGTMAAVREAESTRKLPPHRAARAIVVRRAYEKAMKSKTEEDVKQAKTYIYKDMEAITDPTNPYHLVLHRFMFDLFMLEESWESALQQLRHIEAFITDKNPGRQQAIINGEGGRNSYLMELHRNFARCYDKLGNTGKAREHREKAEKLCEERERTWTREDMENEAQLNLLLALQFALQTAQSGDGLRGGGRPERSRLRGWMRKVWVREPVEAGGPSGGALEGERAAGVGMGLNRS